MKILQIVTLVSPDGAYGGPTRVALNNARALEDLGHEVLLVAGARGYDTFPEHIDGVRVRLFQAKTAIPGVGYAGTTARAMRSWIAESAHCFDVAHVHFARDLVAIPAALELCRSHTPFVVQTHGMITPGSHPLAGPVDLLWTARLLRRADRVLYLNERERADLLTVGGPGLAVESLHNGVPIVDPTVRLRAAISSEPEVLFMARLHPRKGADIFAEAAVSLLRAGVKAHFRIVGPPEGAEAAVDAVVESARAGGITDEQLRREPAVPPDEALARFAAASVYVLPAADEPFGMTIVEALSCGVPVIIDRGGGLADFVTRHECGLVTQSTPQDVAAAIRQLLSAPELASEMGERGREGIRAELSMENVGRRLETIYGTVLAKSRDAEGC